MAKAKTKKAKLKQAGFDHLILGIIIAVVFAIIGVTYIIISRAATSPQYVVGIGGQCLDNNASIKQNGNKIQLYTCNKTGAQKWTFNNGSVVNDNGFCLDVTNASTKEYAFVQLYTCNGTGAQKWTVKDGKYLVNTNSGLCMTAQYAATANGTPLWMKACHGGTAQTWTLKPVASTPQPSPAPSPSPSPTPTPAPTPSPTPSGFTHPGIYSSKPQLDFVKARVAAGAQPWKGAYDKAKGSRYGSLSWSPKPVPSVECGNGGSTLNKGCDAQRDDAAAAYTHAVLWYMSGNSSHAKKAIEILNAWSGKHTSTPWTGTATYGNNLLQTGWAGSNFLKAAEIIRYSNAGWSGNDITAFEGYMKKVYRPLTIDGWSGFNWITLLADTTMDIGIFTNDKATFENGLNDMRKAVPAYVYMSSDGSAPTNASSWNGAKSFSNGITQETCRDLSHTALGVASIVYGAETARIQGVNFYGEQQARLRSMVEFQAAAIKHMESKAANSSYAIPSNFCGGTLKSGGAGYTVTGDAALNHFTNRLGLPMTDQRAYVLKYRPMSNTTNLHMQLETLTHADIGNL